MELLHGLDLWLFHFVNSTLSHPWLDQFFPAITDLHKGLAFQLIVPVAVFALLWRKYQKKSFLIFFGLLISLALNDATSTALLKNQVQRTRPFETAGVVAIQRSPAGGYSFPSNHAANMFNLAGYLGAFLPAVAPFLYAAAALVAYSRVYCGVHYPTDIFVGALWGLLWAYVLTFAVRQLLKRFAR